MKDLPKEVIELIFDMLDLKSQIMFFSISTKYKYLCQYFRIKRNVIVNNINVYYYNALTNITINTLLAKYPKNLRVLKFDDRFNQPIKDHKLPNVTKLIFGWRFNQSIKKSIPDTVRYLEFGNEFDQSIKFLPPLLTHLIFGFFFNKSIKNRIPLTVKYLVFGDRFNHPVCDLNNEFIPRTIEYLKFGSNFNQSIKNLTFDLKSLTVHRSFYLKNEHDISSKKIKKLKVINMEKYIFILF